MLAIHGVGLPYVDGRQELEIEACAASQLLRQRLVEVDADAHAARFGGHLQGVVHLVGREGELRCEAIVLLVGLAVLELGHQIPLLRCGHQAHIAVGGDALAVENHLHRGMLFIDEDRVIGALIENYAEALRVQVAAIIYLHLEFGADGGNGNKQACE